MVTELNNDDLHTINVNQTSGVEKIQPVQSAKAKQNLPAYGKALPPEVASMSTENKAHEPEKSRLDEAVRGLNEHVKTIQRELQFSVDKESGKTIIKVMDKETSEVIRQIPSDEALSVARQLSEGAELELFSSYT